MNCEICGKEIDCPEHPHAKVYHLHCAMIDCRKARERLAKRRPDIAIKYEGDKE